MGFNRVAKVFTLGALSLAFAVSTSSDAAADQYSYRYASSERAAAARGHYARARALLVDALAEFEQGRRIASPDMLLDSEEWRISVISRTEELNKVLDPQPRVTRSGARFKARGITAQRASKRIPAVADGARITNTYGEELRRLEMEQKAAEEAAAPVAQKPVEVVESAPVEEETVEEEVVVEDFAGVPIAQPEQEEAPSLFNEEESAEELTDEVEEEFTSEPEDAEVADAIEKAIQERIEKLEAELEDQ